MIGKIQSIIVSILLLLIGGFTGYYFGVEGYEVRLRQQLPETEIIGRADNVSDGLGFLDIELRNRRDEIPQSVDFTHFWEVWDSITTQHINRPLDPNVLVDGAIKGMVDAIGDPYTSYLDIEQNQSSRQALNGQYEGIGAQLGYNDSDQLIVVAPLDGSPAIAAGVKSGDRILAIEGSDASTTTITEAVNQIRGEAGTPITLTLARAGVEDPFDVTITRDTIKLDSVTWEDEGDGIASIRLSRFGQTTNDEWSKNIGEIIAQMPNLQGVILDVRNNPGGYLDSAVYIASEFISSGNIVTEDFVDGTRQEFRVTRRGQLTDTSIPIVVLVNPGSASASEIVAAALKESRGAIIVGERTFGKGSVQKAQDFSNQTALHVTIAKWITPDGNWIDKHNASFGDSDYNEYDSEGNPVIGGVKPDYIVEFTDEDIENELDVQLEKAIEVLREQL